MHPETPLLQLQDIRREESSRRSADLRTKAIEKLYVGKMMTNDCNDVEEDFFLFPPNELQNNNPWIKYKTIQGKTS